MKIESIFNILFRLGMTTEKVGHSRVAAALVHRNDVVSFGVNSKKTHPFQKLYGRNDMSLCLHAEVAAIKNALRFISVKDLKDCTLYVLRVKQNEPKGSFVAGLSRPCDGCQRAIATFGIKKVYFTEDNGSSFVCL